MRENDCSKEDMTGKEIWNEVSSLISQSDYFPLGKYYSHIIKSDIKHLIFTLSRYKFVSKLLMYRDHVDVIEFGCQEAMGALMFQQNMKLNRYVGIDFDEDAIKWNKENFSDDFEFICGDIFDLPLINEEFDVAVSLDVIEHISSDMEDKYCEAISTNLKQNGIAIIGTPSIHMNPYACEASKIGHINLYDQERLYKLMSKYFHNVFIFNMNDEVVNTGFAPMACYFFAVCSGKK